MVVTNYLHQPAGNYFYLWSLSLWGSIDLIQGKFSRARFVFGSSTSASCTDCHGGHLILKSTDSESTVAAANVPTMCGECPTDAKVNIRLV